jgi:hypothetical protein
MLLLHGSPLVKAMVITVIAMHLPPQLGYPLIAFANINLQPFLAAPLATRAASIVIGALVAWGLSVMLDRNILKAKKREPVTSPTT